MFPVLSFCDESNGLARIVSGMPTAQRTHCAQTSYFVHCNLPSSLSTTLFLLSLESPTFMPQTFYFGLATTLAASEHCAGWAHRTTQPQGPAVRRLFPDKEPTSSQTKMELRKHSTPATPPRCEHSALAQEHRLVIYTADLVKAPGK